VTVFGARSVFSAHRPLTVFRTMKILLQLVLGCSCWLCVSGCTTKRAQKAEPAELHERALSGDPAAQCVLGEAFEFGRGVSPNSAEAAQWYRLAADQGNPVGQFRLGNCYQNGLGVATNLDRAIELYTRAAEQGLMEAQHRMGYLHDVGLGTASDMAAAAGWYRQAAEQGCADAMVYVGISYSQGAGAPCDLAQAYMWLDIARDLAGRDGDSKLKVKTDTLLHDLEGQMTPAQLAEGRLKAEKWRVEFAKRSQSLPAVPVKLQSSAPTSQSAKRL
jgi:TPR repeat protein